MSDITLLPGLQALWSKTMGNSEICIAILDGPVDHSHPSVSEANLSQFDSLVSGKAGNDLASQHGTHICSVIFGQHNSSVKGIAPDCRGIIIPIYSPENGGSLNCSQLDLARAINLAIDQGAHIINISGGELSESGLADPILENAIKRCNENGVLVVASVGNDGCRCLHVPASVASTLAVGAMDSLGNPLSFSNWGDIYQQHGILALGVDIPGAMPGGGMVERTGTSFVAPIVSGIAALLLSIQIKNGEQPDSHRVRAAILESADSCTPSANLDCHKLLAGKLNIASAYTKLCVVSNAGIVGQERPETVGAIYPYYAPVGSGADIGTNHQIKPTSKRSNKVNQSNQFIHRRYNMTENPYIPQPEIMEISSSGIQASEFPVVEEEMVVPVSDGIQGSEINASECACKKAQVAPSLAYVLGQIGYDFGNEARRDSFLQMSGSDVHNPNEFLKYLKSDPASAANVNWTLSLDATVVYAIRPYGPFAVNVYDRLKEFLTAQIKEGAERVSIPGVIQGSTRLLNGQVVPVLYPDLRGMYSWSTSDLIQSCCGERPADEDAAVLHAKKVEGVQNFLDRVYYEVRNLGTSSQERAMNYAATNAFQVADVYTKAIESEMKLDSIQVERSPICRPGSDCWDVKLGFFNPSKRQEQARHVYRFTVDVSEVIPVTVGKVRHWDIY